MPGPKAYVEVRVRLLRSVEASDVVTGRAVISSSETEFEITRNLGQVRREPLARHVIREQVAQAAGDLIDSTLKRAIAPRD